MDTSTTIPARAAQAASEAKNAQITTLEAESSALDAQTADGARPSAHTFSNTCTGQLQRNRYDG